MDEYKYFRLIKLEYKNLLKEYYDIKNHNIDHNIFKIKNSILRKAKFDKIEGEENSILNKKVVKFISNEEAYFHSPTSGWGTSGASGVSGISGVSGMLGTTDELPLPKFF